MQEPKREITISNRYIYYYASLLKRIYGLIIRNEHKNQPDERYIGHLDEDEIPSSQDGRLPGTPVRDEIVLFRFRKRLLIGTCQAVLPRKISEITVLSEDGRRLRFHHPNLVYLTGTSSTDVPLKTYAQTIRALSREIDLEAVWEIAVESATPLPLLEIADLFYNTEIDATQWIALYLHLHGDCPYFQPQASDAYSPYTVGQVNVLLRHNSIRKDRDEEREEFTHAMANNTESIAEHTLTSRQQTYLEQIRQYALWGSESQHATHAQALISEICKTKKNRQKSAVELLVQKKVWKRDQNLDLLRAEVPTAFSDLAIRQAEALAPTGSNLKKQPVFVIHLPDHADIALSYPPPALLGRRVWHAHSRYRRTHPQRFTYRPRRCRAHGTHTLSRSAHSHAAHALCPRPGPIPKRQNASSTQHLLARESGWSHQRFLHHTNGRHQQSRPFT